jgi:hypothetical protein
MMHYFATAKLSSMLGAILLAMWASSAHSAEPPSIASLKIGMTLEEASQLLRAHFQQYVKSSQIPPQMTPYKIAGSANATSAYTYSIIGTVGQPGGMASASKAIQTDTIEVHFTPPPSRIIAIKRSLAMNSGSELSWDSVVEQLRNRYGQERPIGAWAQWFFDANQKSVAAPAASSDRSTGGCNGEPEFRRFADSIKDGGAVGYRKGTPHGSLNPACGTVFHLLANDKGAIASFTTTLIDHAGSIDAVVDGRQYLSGQANAEQKGLTEKAKGRDVPKI